MRRSFPCPKEVPVCGGHFLKIRSILPGVLKPVHNSGFIFYFKAVKFHSPALDTKRGSQNWVISKPIVQFLRLISGDHTLESLWKWWFPLPFPHLPWSTRIHPHSSLAPRAMACTGTKPQWVGRRMGWTLSWTQPWNQSKAHQCFTHRQARGSAFRQTEYSTIRKVQVAHNLWSSTHFRE